jgi:DNA-binding beta-propeller fold protein YncE
MAKPQTQMNEFSIIKEEARSTATVFLAEPKPKEEIRLGRLFAIIEIASTSDVNREILDLMVHDINRYYYRAEANEIEAAFENALQKTNRRLQEMIGEVGEDWLNELTALIGVQKGNELVFANVGRAIALMSHGSSIMDILDTAKAKAQDVSPVKIFSNIVTGEISEGSRILFSTETILDYLSKEKIRRVLAEHEGKKVSNVFHELLGENSNDVNFASLILEWQDAMLPVETEVEPKRVKRLPKEIEADSMEDLHAKQESTEELLSSSLWPGVKNRVKEKVEERSQEKTVAQQYNDDILSGPGGIESPILQEKDWKSVSKKIATSSLAASKKGTLTAVSSIKNGIRKLRSQPLGVKGLAEQSKKKTKVSTEETTRPRIDTTGIEQTLARALTPLVKWIRQLSVVQKIFFVMAILVLIIFANAVIDQDDTNADQEQETSYAETISQIDLRINEGKAATLFDEDEAERLLNEAQDLLDTVPKESESYQQRGDELQGVIQNELNSIRKVTPLFDATSVVNFGDIVDSIAVNRIALLGATAYGFDASNGTIYAGDTENGVATVAREDSDTGSPVAAVKASPGTALIAKESNQLFLYNPIEDTLTNLEIDNAGVNITPIAAAVFGSRVYVLDPTNNQIYRFDELDDGYSGATPWVADDVNLESAVSLAIDADVYILKQNGSVLKMAGGFKEDFALDTVEPAIESAEKIYTDENSDFLYILDRANQRVVVFNKEGAVVNQYTSPSFTDVRDMAIDEDDSELFLLNGNEVFRIELTHLDSAESEEE